MLYITSSVPSLASVAAFPKDRPWICMTGDLPLADVEIGCLAFPILGTAE